MTDADRRDGSGPAGWDADRLRWEVAVEAAGVGAFDWDVRTGVLSWDDRLLEIFGYDRDSFGGTIEAFNQRLHPDDVDRVGRALTTALEECGEYEAEYRVLPPGGGLRWVAARGRVVCGDDGRPHRLVGAVYDTTAHREGDARVTEVLEAMPTAFFSLDPQWRFVYVNAEAERLLQHAREELIGRVVWDLFPAAVGTDFERQYQRAMHERVPVAFEEYYPVPLDAWYEVRAWPSPTGLSVYFLEITLRKTEQQRLERAAARARLLAEVNAQLTTLDVEVAVGRLARIFVPAIADWSLVTLVEDRGGDDWRRGLRDLGWHHAEESLEPHVAGYAHSRLGSLSDSSPLARALLTGEPVIIEDDATQRFLASLDPGEAADHMRALAPEAAAVIPLRGRERVIGLISLYRGARDGFTDDELEGVLEAATRAGLALDNARLYAEQRKVAEDLQRALLTGPPEPDHMQVAVRYTAAAETAQVGGDWYDAFLQRDGATVLVIGDVVGHNTDAAAAMGQLRSVLRGIAAFSGLGPAGVLHGVDEAMQTLEIDTTATVVVARVEQSVEERHRGVTYLRWSNAGHPTPMVIYPDGSVLPLGGLDPDLLLGVSPEVPRHETRVALDRGSTVLLYTDGLVERRDQPVMEGMERLREVLAEVAELPLEELCDAVLARMLPERREDDVALVAVRLHPQDRPRPPEAGPEHVPAVIPPPPG
ncbi:MAG: SpoIIE family protein phosphatase [Kineosporiaceae bacterium]